MPLPRVAGAIIFVGSLLLPAGHRHSRPGDDVPWVVLDDRQKALTSSAVSHLRDEFNRGACQSIYEEAGVGFRFQTSEEWRRECEMLKNELGSWKSFEVKITEGFAKHDHDVFVLIFGVAEFEKANQQVEVNWILNDKGAEMQWIGLRLRDDQIWMQIPDRSRHRWIDPPPPKLPKDSLAS
jgi:hypothetical protein